MNKVLRTLFLTFAFPCYMAYGGMAPQISVHEMFKDLTEEEIVKIMEEGQREMQRIMTSGTPEEQEEFMRMMQETMNSFSEEDFEEINKISKIVEPLLLEKEAEYFKEQEAQTAKAEPVKTEPKKDVVISGDASLEYMLYKINKTITSIFVKVKSDSQLTDILKQWVKKDDFNELVRLLQVLNNKNLISKLTTSKTDDIKKLVETIENFNKRLEIENKQFTVADTFGLEVDKETSAQNSMKFNKILEFFSDATESLLPMVTKFLKEFEPEALLLAKAQDDKAKSSLDAAKQIEKLSSQNQRRPIGAYTGSENIPSAGSSAGYNQQGNYTPARYDGSQGYAGSNLAPQSRRAQNKMNNIPGNNMPGQNVNSPTEKSVKKPEDKAPDKSAEKKVNALKPVLDKIERFDDMFDRSSFDDYNKALIKAGDTFNTFGKEAQFDEKSYETILNPEFRGPLTPAQSALKSNFQSKAMQYGKNIKAAHTHYGELKNSLELTVAPIKEIKSIVESTRASLTTLNLTELNQLHNAPALTKLKQHFNSYESTFKRVQKELKNKHKAHKLEIAHPEEIKAYNELEAKVESLHGLDKIIAETRASFDLLDRAVQAEIKRRKRDTNVK